MTELHIVETPTKDLVPYAGNAKIHTPEQVEQIARSIEEFGFNDPVGVWHDADGRPVIVEGHGRVLAAERLGIEKLPTIALDHLTDAQRRAYVHIHNQTTLTSGFDLQALEAELDSLPEFDWASYGFDMDEALEPLPELTGDEDDLPEPEEVETRCKSGDLWRLGRHLLLCGDSTDPDDLSRLMGGAEVDLLLTDPPYNVAYNQNDSKGWDPEKAHQRPDKMSIQNDAFEDEGAFVAFLADAFNGAKPHMKDGASFYVWFASMHAPAVFEALALARLEPKQELVWVKNHFTLGRQDYQWMHEPCLFGWKGGAGHWFAPTRAETNVIEDRADLRHMSKGELRQMLESILDGDQNTTVLREDKPLSSAEHPTMKPVRLFARLLRNSSRPGDVVLDLFCGSGTTVVACEQMGRECRAMELDPKFCDVIIERWERLTGKKATLVE